MVSFPEKPLRSDKDTEGFWKTYHSKYLKIKSGSDVSSIPEPVYVYFLFSDFTHSVNKMDYTIWDEALDGGKKDFKLEHIRSVLLYLQSFNNEYSTLNLDVLGFLESARKNAKSFSTDDTYYRNFELACRIGHLWDFDFENLHKEIIFDYIVKRWPESSGLFDIKTEVIPEPILRPTNTKNPDTPHYPNVKLTDEDFSQQDPQSLRGYTVLRLWRAGASYTDLESFYYEGPKFLEDGLFDYIKSYLDVEISEVLEKKISQLIEFKTKAKETLPSEIAAKILVCEGLHFELLSKYIKTLNYHLVDFRPKAGEEPRSLGSYVRSALRSDPDLIVANFKDIKEESDYETLTNSLLTGHAIVLIIPEQGFKDVDPSKFLLFPNQEPFPIFEFKPE